MDRRFSRATVFYTLILMYGTPLPGAAPVSLFFRLKIRSNRQMKTIAPKRCSESERPGS